jgi:hypothetical protein
MTGHRRQPGSAAADPAPLGARVALTNPSQAGYRRKGGGPFCDGSACLQIFFGILAGTIPVVIATNSDPGKPLFAIVQTALRAATSPR